MKGLLRTTALTLVIASVAGGGGWVFWGSDLTRCRVVDVQGNDHAEAVEIRHLGNVGLGEPLIGLDLAAAAAGVERHPWVAHAQVRRAFPDRVVITVQERIPTALLLLDQLYLVDADGNVFRRAAGVSLDLPVLTGIPLQFSTEQPDLARRIIQDGLSILAMASDRERQHAGEIPRNAVSEVRFDGHAGYTLVLRNGGEVLLGFEPDDALTRLSRLALKGVDLTLPHRVDLGSPRLAVVTPL